MASFQLANISLGAALANQVSENILTGLDFTRGVLLQANFAYGAGGTSVDAYVQSTADGGATWYDVANFHFTTTAEVRLYNLRSQTPVTSIATPGSGALTANTSIDGLLGDQIRVLWTSVGTYTGASNLTVSAVAR